jgi:coenzyme F420-reducing hydrogenase beta subunit
MPIFLNETLKFTENKISFFLGSVTQCYLGYATDAGVREASASGGIVSSMLIDLMETGAIDGALVSRFDIENGVPCGRSFIATTREEISASGGSIYADVTPVPLKDIREFKGRIGIVGLPCYLKGIRRLCETEPWLKQKIHIKIGLFCGHNSRRELLLKVLEKKKILPGSVDRIRFRKGRWRGQMAVQLNSGETIRFPFSHFSIYQNLHLFSQKKCIHCADHTAEYADVACGDAWLRELKSESIKHSIFITRNRIGEDLVKRMAAADRIRIRGASPEDVFRSQKRSLVHHKSLKAKSKTAPLFGYRIPCSGMSLDRWNDRLAAIISLTNIKWSESDRFKHLIFRIPRPILLLYLLIFKALTNF